MTYTTHGLMTAADMADYRDLYDLNHEDESDHLDYCPTLTGTADECDCPDEMDQRREENARRWEENHQED